MADPDPHCPKHWLAGMLLDNLEKLPINLLLVTLSLFKTVTVHATVETFSLPETVPLQNQIFQPSIALLDPDPKNIPCWQMRKERDQGLA
jgi:hypothetical protein